MCEELAPRVVHGGGRGCSPLLLERLESCHTQLENCDPRCDEAEMTHGSDALATICTCTVPPSAGLQSQPGLLAAQAGLLLCLACLVSYRPLASPISTCVILRRQPFCGQTRDLQFLCSFRTHICDTGYGATATRIRGCHRAQVFSCAALKRT